MVGVARAGAPVVVARTTVVVVVVDVEVVVVDVEVVEVVDSGGAEVAVPVSSTAVSGPQAASNTRSRIPPIRRIPAVSATAGRDLSVL